MPHKGFFSQAVTILLSDPVSLDQIEPLIADLSPRRVGNENKTAFGGPAISAPYRPDVNGYLLIDVENQPWPDDMGDSKQAPELFAAWSMGHYGPFAFPFGLKRSSDHWWSKPELRGKIPDHRAFVRLRISYILGAAPDAKVLPADYNPRHELDFLMSIVEKLFSIPGALFYFNPNGEVLSDPKQLSESISFHAKANLPPLDLWSNVRLFNVTPEWTMMDTVGMEQLDVPDLEACFPKTLCSGTDVANFLRNACAYLMANGEVINDGDTMDGPAERRWQFLYVKDPLAQPPRRVMRCLPLGLSSVPNEVWPQKKEKAGLFAGIKNLFGRRK